MLEIFEYFIVVHFTDQDWVSKAVCCIRRAMVCKIVLQTETRNFYFCVCPWSMLTILNFFELGR